jgi:hypothetical protein
MKIITLVLLVSLFISDTITAQTGKTVKIGNQVWMSENLGTSAGSNTKPTTASSQRQAEAIPQKPKSVNCNYKFSKPQLQYQYRDNRKTCCCCEKRYAEYEDASFNRALFSSVFDQKIAKEIRYLLEKLELHYLKINADENHKTSDNARLLLYVLETYGQGVESEYIVARQTVQLLVSMGMTDDLGSNIVVEDKYHSFVRTCEYCSKSCCD